MQDSRCQQPYAESLASEKDGTHNIAKPVAPERVHKKKQNRHIPKSSSDGDELTEKKPEGFHRGFTGEVGGPVYVEEAAVKHVIRETKIECWKLDMMRTANIEGLSQEGVKISSKDNEIVVDGKPEKVTELCNLLVDLDDEIKHREIPIPNDQNLMKFLNRPTVIQYIGEMLSKANINNHWELNEKRPLIDLFIFGKERLQEACGIIEKSFCHQMQRKADTTLLHHLRKSERWHIKIENLSRELDNKVMYILNGSCYDVSITCTHDLKDTAVDRLEEMERVLEKEMVLHLKDGKQMLLLKYPLKIKQKHVTLKILSDEKCIIFDGEGDVKTAKVDIKLITLTFKHSEIKIQEKEILDFLQRDSVVSFINESLLQKKLTVHWQVNRDDGVIDVFMENDEKLQFACDFIAATYCKQDFHFSNNPEGLEQFNQKLKHILDKHGDNIHWAAGADSFTVVFTCDVLPEIVDTYKECQVTAITMDFHIKERATYEFIKTKSAVLKKIQETQSVVIEPCDDCCKFVMKGSKKKLDAAKDTLKGFCSQKISKKVVPICLKRFSKFRNGDYASVCMELEKDCCIQWYEKLFEDVRYNEQGSEIIVTNRPFKHDVQNKVAVVVPTEDIGDSHVDIREEIQMSAYCSSKNLKLEGGKDVQQLQEIFKNLLEAVEERELWTLVIPIDDLKSCTRQEKFTKLFIRSYCGFVRNQTRHITGIVIQVLDRKTWRTVSGAVSDYLKSRDSNFETASGNIKFTQPIRIKIEEGELAEKKADVIVNSVGSSLVLSTGAVSQSLLRVAGQGLQDQVRTKRPTGLKQWQMVETAGYNLQCSKVYHVVLGSVDSSKKCLKAFKGLITDCLYEMDKSSFRTIAFPVLGTGSLGYTADQVADVMMKAVEKYCRNNTSTSIKEVTIVVYPEPKSQIRKVFEDRLEAYRKAFPAKYTAGTEEDTEPCELAIVGCKDAVAKAKDRLEEIFKQEDVVMALEARRIKESSETGVLKGDREEAPAFGRSAMKKTSSAKKSQSSKQSGNISHLDKLLDDVRVEVRKKFIGKLPDTSVLKVLGLFKVRHEEKDGKCWLTGKLTDLEKAGDFLKTIIKSPLQLYQTKDVPRDVYDLVCSKFEEFKDRITFNVNTGKVTILKVDKEVEACLELYSKYQFEELIAECKTASGVHRFNALSDKKAAECLKLEKGEEYANVEFFISPKDTVLKIAAPSYTILSTFKFALEVRTNRKQLRGRQGRSDIPVQELKRIENKEEGDAEATHSNETIDLRKYETSQGLQIYVYKYDILKLKVDCIVNAANKELEHGGGVAKVIARAAGYELKKESEDYINNYGYLRVGTCCTTTAGNLKYKYVIHTVGPNYQDYWPWQYEIMKSDLKKAVRVCFDVVEKSGLSSIGMTSISSGVYGVPKAWCAEAYAYAVQEYSMECGRNTSLKEIHFVDVNDEILAEITKRFEGVFNISSKHHGFEIGQNKQPDKTTGQRPESISIKSIVHGRDNAVKYTEDYPQWYTDEKKSIFELNKNMKVVIYTDTLTNFRMGAICCSQDINLRSEGSIAHAIKELAGQNLDESLKKQRQSRIRIGDVIVTTPGKLRCSNVYHVVSPDFKTQTAQGVSDAFLSEVETGYIKCLQKAHEQGLQKIAVPLFGCGILSRCVDKLAKTFQSAVMKFCNDVASKNTELREIHAINEKPGVTHKIKTGFLDYFEGTALKGQVKGIFDEDGIGHNNLLNESHKSKESSLSTISRRDFKTPDTEYFDKQFDAAEISADKTCPICLDSFNNPKKLSRCGHIFCSECIEGQFKVTPKCPNCSTMYGIITGDQPEGNISVDTDRTTKLCGYEDCNTIVITYNFKGGIQGRNHPQPGKRYKGITRKGYLPDNAEGRLISEMLKVAFARKLVFTIGNSRTTGHEGVITWNDIHHKTDLRPNSTFGYPDRSYLGRIKDELAAKGVTPEDVC